MELKAWDTPNTDKFDEILCLNQLSEHLFLYSTTGCLWILLLTSLTNPLSRVFFERLHKKVGMERTDSTQAAREVVNRRITSLTVCCHRAVVDISDWITGPCCFWCTFWSDANMLNRLFNVYSCKMPFRELHMQYLAPWAAWSKLCSSS